MASFRYSNDDIRFTYPKPSASDQDQYSIVRYFINNTLIMLTSAFAPKKQLNDAETNILEYIEKFACKHPELPISIYYDLYNNGAIMRRSEYMFNPNAFQSREAEIFKERRNPRSPPTLDDIKRANSSGELIITKINIHGRDFLHYTDTLDRPSLEPSLAFIDNTCAHFSAMMCATQNFTNDYPEITTDFRFHIIKSRFSLSKTFYRYTNKSEKEYLRLAEFTYSNDGIESLYPKPSVQDQYYSIVHHFIDTILTPLLQNFTAQQCNQTFFSAPSAATASSNNQQPQVRP